MKILLIMTMLPFILLGCESPTEEVSEITITYYLELGETLTSVIVDQNVNLPLLSASREGFEFLGWTFDLSNVEIINDTQIASEDTNLFAVWKVIPENEEPDVEAVSEPAIENEPTEESSNTPESSEDATPDETVNDKAYSIDFLEPRTPYVHKDIASIESIPNVILNVVTADDDGFWDYESEASGFFRATISYADPFKISENLIYYDAVIWKDSNIISLYQLSNDYDYFYELTGATNAELKAYREQYLIMDFDMFPTLTDDGLVNFPEQTTDFFTYLTEVPSEYLKYVFEQFAEVLVQRHPDADHHLTYIGHGAPGGHLFEALMLEDDVVEFLDTWTKSLGKRLGIIDMGGPCDKGSMLDLLAFSPFSRYYIASDLPNGGYDFDNFTIEIYDKTNVNYQYHSLFNTHEDLGNVVEARIALKRERYKYSKNHMIENKVEQVNYAYDSEAFLAFHTAFSTWIDPDSIIQEWGEDTLTFMQRNDAPDSLIEMYEKIFFAKADNRDFFEWEETIQGLHLNEEYFSSPIR